MVIFISYRRGDSSGHAGRLYDRCCARYGSPESVIMDVSINPGVDFRRISSKALSLVIPSLCLLAHNGYHVQMVAGIVG